MKNIFTTSLITITVMLAGCTKNPTNEVATDEVVTEPVENTQSDIIVEPPVKEEEEPVKGISKTSKELYLEFHQEPELAAKAYEDSLLDVTGEVDSVIISKDLSNSMLFLKTTKDTPLVMAEGGVEFTDQIKNVKENTKVTVQCKSEGVVVDAPKLTNCTKL